MTQSKKNIAVSNFNMLRFVMIYLPEKIKLWNFSECNYPLITPNYQDALLLSYGWAALPTNREEN